MVTTSPLVTALLAAGDSRVIVPCGWSLLGSGCSLSEVWFCCAHASATDCSWPTKLGSGGPALTVMVTGLGCGHEVPAAGLVLITMPAAIVADTWLATGPGVSPACRSAACAAVSASPLTCGTPISFGPSDGNSSTVAPLRTFAPAAGDVLITSPLASPLSSRPGSVSTLKPRPR